MKQWKAEKKITACKSVFSAQPDGSVLGQSRAHQLFHGRQSAFQRLHITYAHLTHRPESHTSVCSLAPLQQVAAEAPPHHAGGTEHPPAARAPSKPATPLHVGTPREVLGAAPHLGTTPRPAWWLFHSPEKSHLASASLVASSDV